MRPKEAGKSRHRRRAYPPVAIHDVSFCSDLRTYVLANQWIFRCLVWIHFEENTGIRSRTKYLKVSKGILFLLFIHSIYKRWKGKMENISTTCKSLLQISQNRSPNRVCPPSKVSHCSSVTRINNPRRLFIANGKFLRVLMCRVFFQPKTSISSHLRNLAFEE